MRQCTATCQFLKLIKSRLIVLNHSFISSLVDRRYHSTMTLVHCTHTKCAVYNVQFILCVDILLNLYKLKFLLMQDITTVKQFEFSAWQNGCDTPMDTESMINLLKAVQSWQPEITETSPVLIHCRFCIKKNIGMFKNLI